jgi:Protein of unknown function (DUF1638)
MENFTMVEGNKPCLIACGIFREELGRIIDDNGFKADIQYLNPGLHNDPKSLEKALSKAIDLKKRLHQNNIVVVYGDVCLGFQNEMKVFAEKHEVVKVDALNCIDCLLGGKGKLLEIDPKHEYFFLNPAWIELEFGNRDKTKTTQEVREEFSMLSGLYLLDTLGNLDDHNKVIGQISEFTGLPVVERKDIGLDGIRKTVLEAMEQLR